MHYLLFCELADDSLARRGEFRSAHLALGWPSPERGELVLGGALTAPADTSVLLFRADSADVAEPFARADPYVLNGLVERWSVRGWTTVIGALAANPIRPETVPRNG
jgi:uncharacterized protein